MRFRRHRYPARTPVTLKSGGTEQRCTIDNINDSGARLSKVAHIARGDEVTLQLSFGRAQGIVQWVSQDHIGVVFRPQIPLRIVDAMRQGCTPTKAPRNFGHGLREMR